MQSIDPNLIVFQSWPDFSDSSRALYQYASENSSFETFWVVREEPTLLKMRENGIACALEGSEEANAMIAKAQFLVSAAYELVGQKQPGQIFVSTWHGFALKLTGFFESAVADPAAFDTIRELSTLFDAVTMTSQAARLFFSGMYACDPRKVFTTGFPRNDYLFSQNGKEHLTRILDRDISTSKLILYLPTMRKSLKEEGAQFGDNLFNYEDFDALALERFLEEHDAYLVAKLHPSDEALLELGSHAGLERLIIMNSGMLEQSLLTIYHVLNAFDCLITDYSSIYVDYLLLDRPIVFSCPDLEQYGEERGFCVDDPTLLMPGAIVKSQSELLENLGNTLGGTDTHAAERTRMLPFFHTHADGASSKRVLDLMNSMAKKRPADIAKDAAHLYLDPSKNLYRYSLDVTGELFLDQGDGFSAANMMKVPYSADTDPVVIELDVAQGTRAIRFDPYETGRFALQDLEVTVNGAPVTFTTPGCVKIDALTIFPRIDPQIIVPLDAQHAQRVTICFKAIDSLSSSLEKPDVTAMLIERSHDANRDAERSESSGIRKFMRALNPKN